MGSIQKTHCTISGFCPSCLLREVPSVMRKEGDHQKGSMHWSTAAQADDLLSYTHSTLTLTIMMHFQLLTMRGEMFYLTTHSTHFIYGYMASDIWLRTILIVRKETCCRHIGYSYRLTARVLLYAPSHRQDNTYHGLCYTSRGALAGTRNSSMGPPHEGSIRWPITPWANLTLSVV